jgi:hypothetical protein
MVIISKDVLVITVQKPIPKKLFSLWLYALLALIKLLLVAAKVNNHLFQYP